MIEESKDSEKTKKKDKDDKPHIVVKNAADYQRLKLEKLMKNPDKPVIIPERPKEKGAPHVPDFVRNVMGSSAGAGSGEFHVYRHLRRKEYARQKYMQERAKRDELDNEYQKKLEENRKLAEQRTAKKRAKRLKKKQRQKKEKKPKVDKDTKDSSSSERSEESESQEDNESEDQKNCEESSDGNEQNLRENEREIDSDQAKQGTDETSNVKTDCEDSNLKTE